MVKKLYQRCARIITDCLSIKQQQYLLAVVGVLIFIILGSYIYQTAFISPQSAANDNVKANTNDAKTSTLHQVDLATVSDDIDVDGLWRSKIHQEQKSLATAIGEIKEDLQRQQQEPDTPDSQLQALKQELFLLKQNLNILQERQKLQPEPDYVEAGNSFKLSRITLNLEPHNNIRKPNVADTIPAGSFAKGVLLSGIDAATSLTAPSEPKPLLIRLVDPGTLPRSFKSDLQDCHVIASGYGDISSERLYARLEKLSCAERSTGEIVETAVAGYIAGEDGRIGVRGNVVEKTRGYIEKSIIGGVLQGVAGVIAPSSNTVLSSTGIFSEKQSKGERLRSGLADGATNSMDRLSKYYIDRAESIQPIIQIASGRVLDVVFTEGAAIGTEQIKEQLAARRQKAAVSRSNNELGQDSAAQSVEIKDFIKR
ncbi:MAG: TraB/VirB10 family protein [Pseudomonadota bacterium]